MRKVRGIISKYGFGCLMTAFITAAAASFIAYEFAVPAKEWPVVLVLFAWCAVLFAADRFAGPAAAAGLTVIAMAALVFAVGTKDLSHFLILARSRLADQPGFIADASAVMLGMIVSLCALYASRSAAMRGILSAAWLVW